MLLEVANSFTTTARVPRGHGNAGQAHPNPYCRWDPHPQCVSPPGALHGRVQPLLGSPLGRGGSREGRTQAANCRSQWRGARAAAV